MRRTWITVGCMVAALVTASVAVGPVARADEAPHFKGRCVAAHFGYANEWQSVPKRNMYVDIPISCTGVLRGRSVRNHNMRVVILGYPALVTCGGTSIAPKAGLLLLEPFAGGRSLTNLGLMTIDNRKRTVAFNGVRLPSTQNLTLGRIIGSFKFSKPDHRAL